MTVFGFVCMIATVLFAVAWRLGCDRIADMKAALDRSVQREKNSNDAFLRAVSNMREARLAMNVAQMHSGKLSRIIHSQRMTIGKLKERSDYTVASIRKALEWLRLSDEAMSPPDSLSQVDHGMLTLGECLLQIQPDRATPNKSAKGQNENWPR